MDYTNDNYCAVRSRHPGGVQVLFADGSVQFIGNSIDSHYPNPPKPIAGEFGSGWLRSKAAK